VPATTISVCIIEDLDEIRDGLAALIDDSDGYRCAGAFGAMEEALERLPGNVPALPDVALIDIGLPGMSGIAGVRLLRERWPSISSLMLTVHDENQRIFEALCAGANGYLLKNTPPERLLESIRDVAEGGAPMSPEVARRVVQIFREFQPPPDADYDLTPHESRILQMLVRGENCKTTAEKLGATVHAISYHLRNIYEKLQVHSRTEAVAKALRSGMFR
jgi:DNA-binding NarL/FixJ family response regulator